jgi:hypothetical protein
MKRAGDWGFIGRSGLSGLQPMSAARRARPACSNDNPDPAERMRSALNVIATLTVAEEGESYEALLALIIAARETAAAALEGGRR